MFLTEFKETTKNVSTTPFIIPIIIYNSMISTTRIIALLMNIKHVDISPRLQNKANSLFVLMNFCLPKRFKKERKVTLMLYILR